jgi:hypothetical protein
MKRVEACPAARAGVAFLKGVNSKEEPQMACERLDPLGSSEYGRRRIDAKFLS